MLLLVGYRLKMPVKKKQQESFQNLQVNFEGQLNAEDVSSQFYERQMGMIEGWCIRIRQAVNKRIRKERINKHHHRFIRITLSRLHFPFFLCRALNVRKYSAMGVLSKAFFVSTN